MTRVLRPSDASLEPSGQKVPKVAIRVECALLGLKEIGEKIRPGGGCYLAQTTELFSLICYLLNPSNPMHLLA